MKLKLYNQLKFNVTRVRYFQYPDPVIREVVTEIRISCHKLPLEQGRYNNVRTNKKIIMQFLQT